MLSFFASVWNWVKLLKAIWAAYLFIKGEIEEAQFNERIKEIKEGTDKAQTGELTDRLEGGQDVEDHFNRHV